MKFLENAVDNIKHRYFDQNKPLHKIWPLFDALETFLFNYKEKTRSGPHIRDALDNKRYMAIVIGALHPAMFYAIWNIGVQSLGAGAAPMDIIFKGVEVFLPLLIVSYGVGLFWEFFFCIIKGHAISEGFLVSGMLIALIMPPNLPLWMMAVAVSFGVILVKEVFGGSGMNILNPALSVRAFLYFTYPSAMSGNAVWVDGGTTGTTQSNVTGATVLGEAQRVATEVHGQLAQYYKDVKNAIASGADQFIAPPQLQPLVQDGVFKTSDYSLGLMDMITGNHAGSLGETSIIAILLGAGLLLVTRIGSWRTMFSVLAGALVTGWIYNLIGAGQMEAYQAKILGATTLEQVKAAGEIYPNLYFSMPSHYHLLVGGLMFGAVFMATDPVSSPSRNFSKYIYGFMIGVLTVVVRVSNPAYPEGIMMAILFMNIFAPTIDYFVINSNIKKRKRNA